MRWWKAAALGCVLSASGAVAEDILQTVGLTDCGDENSFIRVKKVDMKYRPSTQEITFDVSGTSRTEQKVIAHLSVTAYGQDIYQNSFDPCDNSTLVAQLCPGNFAARGTLPIPSQYASMVPAIAYQIPDIAALANLQLVSVDSNETVACVQSQVSNGKTASVPAVSYIAAGLAGVALLATGIAAAGAAVAGGSSAAAGAGAGTGAGTVHPSFGEFLGALQGIALTGMVSVPQPPIVRSFSQNFAFSLGLVSWGRLQESIDDFRARTGGDLSHSSYALLRNTTLVFPDGSTVDARGGNAKRSLDSLVLLTRRAIETSINGTNPELEDDGDGEDFFSTVKKTVSGITAYSEQLLVPEANTFLTMLLVVTIVIAAIVVIILLVKVILELWALCANYPKKFRLLREDYWGIIVRTITSLILLVYGIWVLFCIYQFSNGDSWAAKLLAGTTLGMFSVVLAFFSWKIFDKARRLKAEEGDASGLFDRKEIWNKYSIFYDEFRKSRWWLFVPNMVYLLLRGIVVAGLNGKGFAQTIALLAVESVMLLFTAFMRPYERLSGNILNIAILVVRVVSVVLLLIFVDELGMGETTKSVSGVALIAVQSALTGVLGVLIIWNGIIALCKENPHRRRRKDLEKRRSDALTPLDARNSLLKSSPSPSPPPPLMAEDLFGAEPMMPRDRRSLAGTAGNATRPWRPSSPERYYAAGAAAAAPPPEYRSPSPIAYNDGNGSNSNESHERLIPSPPPPGPGLDREPTLPFLGRGGHQRDQQWKY